VAAAMLLLTQVHISELSQENSKISLANNELHYVTLQNSSLRSRITSLEKLSSIAHLATVQYGLIGSKQKEYAITSMLAGGKNTGVPRSNISPGQLEEGDAAALAGSPLLPIANSGDKKSSSEGVLHKMLDQLEFWTWSF